MSTAGTTWAQAEQRRRDIVLYCNVEQGRSADELWAHFKDERCTFESFKSLLSVMKRAGQLARKRYPADGGLLCWYPGTQPVAARSPNAPPPRTERTAKAPKPLKAPRAPRSASHIVIPPHHSSVRAQPQLPPGPVEIPEHLIQRHPGFAYAPLVPERDHSLHARPGSADFKSIRTKGF